MQVTLFNSADHIIVSYDANAPKKLKFTANLKSFLNTQPSPMKRKIGESGYVTNIRKDVISEISKFEIAHVSFKMKLVDDKGEQMVKVLFKSNALKSVWDCIHLGDEGKVCLQIKYAGRSNENPTDFVAVNGMTRNKYGFYSWEATVPNITNMTVFDPIPSLHVMMTLDIPDDWIAVTENCGISPTKAKLYLESGILSDATIIAANGTAVKVHQIFLSANSSVFANMFQSGMKESQTGQVELTNMSEKGVWAFLRYIYYRNLSIAMENDEIAFELLCAGHMFQVLPLEEKMLSCLKEAMKNEDFDVGLAFKMYMYARNVESESFAELKKAAIQVLNAKPKELKLVPEFKEIFESPDVAMGFCQEFIKTVASSLSV